MRTFLDFGVPSLSITFPFPSWYLQLVFQKREWTVTIRYTGTYTDIPLAQEWKVTIRGTYLSLKNGKLPRLRSDVCTYLSLTHIHDRGDIVGTYLRSFLPNPFFKAYAWHFASHGCDAFYIGPPTSRYHIPLDHSTYIGIMYIPTITYV